MYEVAIAELVKLAAIEAVVGDRAYPLEFPQNPIYPAILWKIVSTPRRYTHTGNDGLLRVRVQFDCVGETYDDACAVRDAVVEALDGYTGTPGGVRVQRIFISLDTDGTDSASQRVGAGPRVRRKILEATMVCKGA
jgi:hypothetical protein